VMAFCLRVGWALVGRPPRAPGVRGTSAVALWARMAPHLWPLVVGTTVIGLAAALLTYAVTYRIASGLRAKRLEAMQVAESRPSDADFHLDKPDTPK
jgi:uncharacterized protein (DUF2062 family)